MILFVVYPAQEYKNRPANDRCKEMYIDKITGSLQIVTTTTDILRKKGCFFFFGGGGYLIILREKNLLPGLNSEMLNAINVSVSIVAYHFCQVILLNCIA